MSAGKILKEFANQNKELTSSGLEAVENLARVVNEFQTKVADGVPFELIGDLISATISDMIPTQAKLFINLSAFMTMLIVFMITMLMAKKVSKTFFTERSSEE